MTQAPRDPLRSPETSVGRILVSYPKSGRTWVRFALGQFDIDVLTTHAGTATNRRQIGRPFGGIPPELADRALAFLHRDPIDTAVSMFYQVHKRDLRPWSGRWMRMLAPLALRGALPPGEIDRFVLHPGYGLPKICAYNRAWLDHLAKRKDCLILRYEDLRADPAFFFQSLLDFFGITHVDGAALAEVSSFDRMKQVEWQAQSTDRLNPTDPKDPASAKVRRGKVKGYLEELRPETAARCEEIARSFGFETN